MSVRLGDHYIKISSAVALNSIRKDEELEKGWRKNEIRLPAEFRDLDPVHVVPLKRVEIKITLMLINLVSTLQKDRFGKNAFNSCN